MVTICRVPAKIYARPYQEHGKTSIHHRLGDTEERFTEWVLHRLSRAVLEFAEQFSNPVIVFEDMSGIRDEITYGTYRSLAEQGVLAQG